MKSGRKGQNREGSFTLPLVTNRAGYATARGSIPRRVLIFFTISIQCVSCQLASASPYIQKIELKESEENSWKSWSKNYGVNEHLILKNHKVGILVIHRNMNTRPIKNL